MLRGLSLFLSFLIYVKADSAAAPVSVLDNYGPFHLKVTTFDMCKGPKLRDCGVSVGRVDENGIIYFKLNLTQNVKVTKGKIEVNSNGKASVVMHVKKPCNHLFARPIFSTLFKINKDCVVMKGVYSESVDIEKIVQTYYGGKFLYGNMTLKSIFTADDCNFACAVNKATLYPRIV